MPIANSPWRDVPVYLGIALALILLGADILIEASFVPLFLLLPVFVWVLFYFREHRT